MDPLFDDFDYSQMDEGKIKPAPEDDVQEYVPGAAWMQDEWQFQAGSVTNELTEEDIKQHDAELSPGTSERSSTGSNRPATPAPTAPLALTIPTGGKVVYPRPEINPLLEYSFNLPAANTFSLGQFVDNSNQGLTFPQPQPQADMYSMFGQPQQQSYIPFAPFAHSVYPPPPQSHAIQQRHISLCTTPSPTTPRRSPRRHNASHTQLNDQMNRISFSSTSTSTSSSRKSKGKTQKSPIIVLKKKIEHNRRLRNDEGNRPQDIYRQRPPRSKWGPFRYQDLGVELYPLLNFSAFQLMDFMTNRAGASKERKLTVWIQNTPAQVNNRYHLGTNSSKCRWENCPAPKNTILKGFWRVAFDEDSDKTGSKYDPFPNAGYMHLFCFEECFNLGFLIHAAPLLGFHVTADVREFEFESRNPMSLTRDHKELLDIYEQWAVNERAKYPMLDDTAHLKRLGRRGVKEMCFMPVPSTPTHERLWNQLTVGHLTREVATRAATRNDRGGANIGAHQGDLRLYAKLRKARPTKAESPAPETPKKRKRGNDSGDELYMPNPSRSPPAQPPAPRPTSFPKPPSYDNTVDGEFEWDDGYMAAQPSQQHLPRPQLPLPSRATRRTSKCESSVILDTLASPVRMTRRTSQALQERLSSQPQFVQQQVLASIPEHLQEIFDDKLEERLAQLPKRRRLEIARFIRKQERIMDRRNTASL